ncbi:MAG TPA: DNA-3-methyladenine glycosylase I [Actinomycetota bacterium]|nr:DNA-3-methyladenine glycosylase I [Actinomycetota bacterium]
MTREASLPRCGWVPLDDALSVGYHDDEWGVPVHDDRRLFEMLVLEGAQAGLSWSTILRKREGYRRAFARFDPRRVASLGDDDVERLMGDASIVRNRAKIRATIANARATLDVKREHGSLDAFLWAFVDGEPIVNRRRTLDEIPAETDESRAMSKALKRAGFRFVGPTISYAFMQAVGMVNDHLLTCFRYDEVGR